MILASSDSHPPPSARRDYIFCELKFSLNESVGVRGNEERDADLGMLTTDEIEANQIRIQFFVSTEFLRRKFSGFLFARFCGVELDALL